MQEREGLGLNVNCVVANIVERILAFSSERYFRPKLFEGMFCSWNHFIGCVAICAAYTFKNEGCYCLGNAYRLS